MIGVDHAGSVHIPAHQRPRRLALAADVVSVLAQQLIERHDLEILCRALVPHRPR